jgi:hypothetical protein
MATWTIKSPLFGVLLCGCCSAYDSPNCGHIVEEYFEVENDNPEESTVEIRLGTIEFCRQPENAADENCRFQRVRLQSGEHRSHLLQRYSTRPREMERTCSLIQDSLGGKQTNIFMSSRVEFKDATSETIQICERISNPALYRIVADADRCPEGWKLIVGKPKPVLSGLPMPRTADRTLAVSVGGTGFQDVYYTIDFDPHHESGVFQAGRVKVTEDPMIRSDALPCGDLILQVTVTNQAGTSVDIVHRWSVTCPSEPEIQPPESGVSDLQ